MVAFILIITVCADMHNHGCRMVQAGAWATRQECLQAIDQWRTEKKFKGQVKYQCALRISGLAEEEEK